MTKMDLYACKRLIREQNAKDLKRAWKKFLKRQAKNVKHK